MSQTGPGEVSVLCQNDPSDLISTYTEKGGENSFLLKALSVEVLISSHWPCKTCLVRSFWRVCNVRQTTSDAQPLSELGT